MRIATKKVLFPATFSLALLSGSRYSAGTDLHNGRLESKPLDELLAVVLAGPL
jgi:hypothetical protein